VSPGDSIVDMANHAPSSRSSAAWLTTQRPPTFFAVLFSPRVSRRCVWRGFRLITAPTKAAVQIINLIVDFIVAFVTMSHVARPSLADVADAASNGVGYGTNQTLLTAVELPTRRPLLFER
jgi:hypothetical protein